MPAQHEERRRRGFGDWMFLGGPAVVVAAFQLLFSQGYCASPLSEAKAVAIETRITDNETANQTAHKGMLESLKVQGDTIIKNQTQIDFIIKAQDRMYRDHR